MKHGRSRPSSIFAGLLLVILGVIFFIGIFYPRLRLGHIIAVYWPVLLIVWGLAKILDYPAARHFGEPRPAIVTAGEAALMVVLAVVLGGFVARDWVRNHHPNFLFEMPELGPSFTRSEKLPPQKLPANARLAIDIARGDIVVQGHAGDDLIVHSQKRVWGLSHRSANRAMQDAQLKVENFGGLYRIRPLFGVGNKGRTSIDLTLEAPSSASVAATTNHGDIRISRITGSVQAHTGNGDVAVSGAGGDVALNLNGGDARISSADGNVRITGHGDDVDIADVQGGTSLVGPFDGSIHERNVTQTVQCALPWSTITIGHLQGTLDTDLGDLSILGATGGVRVTTHNTDIKLKDVRGRLDIADANGDIRVALSAPPSEDINITDNSGDVELTLPAESTFELAAVSRSGDVHSDFQSDQLNVSNTDSGGQMTGRVGPSGGPKITIATTYGTIHVHKGE